MFTFIAAFLLGFFAPEIFRHGYKLTRKKVLGKSDDDDKKKRMLLG